MFRRSAIIPNPMCSLEQWDQFHHRDIEYLSDEDLRTELYRRKAVIWERPELKRSWLQERVEKLEAEIKRRRKSSVFSNYTDNKPKLAEGVRL